MFDAVEHLQEILTDGAHPEDFQVISGLKYIKDMRLYLWSNKRTNQLICHCFSRFLNDKAISLWYTDRDAHKAFLTFLNKQGLITFLANK